VLAQLKYILAEFDALQCDAREQHLLCAVLPLTWERPDSCR
jgi:hypothetical protein